MSKERITGAEALMRSLEHQGVKTLFGYPGGSIINGNGRIVKLIKQKNQIHLQIRFYILTG